MKINLNTNNNSEEPAYRPLNFEIPPGDYRIKFAESRETINKAKKRNLRILWDLVIPSSSVYKHRVWKEYKLDSDRFDLFRKDLCKIFGNDLSRFSDDSGVLDTEKLIGEEAEAEIGHKKVEKYNKPLVVVKKLFPVGHFTLAHLQRPFSR